MRSTPVTSLICSIRISPLHAKFHITDNTQRLTFRPPLTPLTHTSLFLLIQPFHLHTGWAGNIAVNWTTNKRHNHAQFEVFTAVLIKMLCRVQTTVTDLSEPIQRNIEEDLKHGPLYHEGGTNILGNISRSHSGDRNPVSFWCNARYSGIQTPTFRRNTLHASSGQNILPPRWWKQLVPSKGQLPDYTVSP